MLKKHRNPETYKPYFKSSLSIKLVSYAFAKFGNIFGERTKAILPVGQRIAGWTVDFKMHKYAFEY